MHSYPYLRVIPDEKYLCFEKKKCNYFTAFGVQGGLPIAAAITPLKGPQKPEVSRCSDTDEKYLCFEKIIYLFLPFLVCRAICPWHTAITLGEPEGSKCSEMHSQPYLRPN